MADAREVQFMHLAGVQQSLRRDFRNADKRVVRAEAALARNRNKLRVNLLRATAATERRARAQQRLDARNSSRLRRVPPPARSLERTQRDHLERALGQMAPIQYETVIGPTVMGVLHEAADGALSCVCPRCRRLRRFGPVPALPGDWKEGYVPETKTYYFYQDVDDDSTTLTVPRGSHPALRVVAEAGNSVAARCRCPVPAARKRHLMRLIKQYAHEVGRQMAAHDAAPAPQSDCESDCSCSGGECDDSECEFWSAEVGKGVDELWASA